MESTSRTSITTMHRILIYGFGPYQQYTTNITEAIVRSSYIKNEDVRRILVIPEEREKLLHRKTNAPLLKDKIAEQGWEFIFFKDILELGSSRRKVGIESFNKLPKQLIDDRYRQMTLEETDES